MTALKYPIVAALLIAGLAASLVAGLIFAAPAIPGMIAIAVVLLTAAATVAAIFVRGPLQAFCLGFALASLSCHAVLFAAGDSSFRVLDPDRVAAATIRETVASRTTQFAGDDDQAGAAALLVERHALLLLSLLVGWAAAAVTAKRLSADAPTEETAQPVRRPFLLSRRRPTKPFIVAACHRTKLEPQPAEERPGVPQGPG